MQERYRLLPILLLLAPGSRLWDWFPVIDSPTGQMAQDYRFR